MRSMSRALALPSLVLAAALTVAACSDGPSVSSQTHSPGDPGSSASGDDSLADGADAQSPSEDPGTEESPTEDATSEQPTDEETTEEPTSEDPDGEEPTEDPDAPADPGAPDSDEPDSPTEPTEPPTSGTPDDPPGEEPTTTPPPETPSESPTETPTEGPELPAPGADAIRAATGATRAAHPSASILSAVQIDDGGAEARYLVVGVEGEERIEVTLDAAYAVVGQNSAPADEAALALAGEDVISLEDALGRATSAGILDGQTLRSIELVRWEGRLTWDLYVFGNPTLAGTVDAASGATATSRAV